MPTTHDRRSRPAAAARRPGEERDVGRDHHHVAVGEVDQPEDPEDHRQPDRHQRVQAARAQRVDDLLDRVVGHSATPPTPRYDCSTFGSWRSSRAGPSSVIAAGLDDVRPVGDVERVVDVLLDEQDRPALALQLRMTSKICSTISGARPSDGSSSRSSRGRLISARADRQHLLLAARERPAGLAEALLQQREQRRRRFEIAADARPRRRPRRPPAGGSRATVRLPKIAPALRAMRDAQRDDPVGRGARDVRGRRT